MLQFLTIHQSGYKSITIRNTDRHGVHAVLSMAVSEVLRCYNIDRVQSMGACCGCDADRERVKRCVSC